MFFFGFIELCDAISAASVDTMDGMPCRWPGKHSIILEVVVVAVHIIHSLPSACYGD